MPNSRSVLSLASVVFTAVLLACPSVAVAQSFDRWYTLTMLDAPAGWMHTARTAEGDRVTSTSEMELRVRRGTLELKFRLSSRFVETANGAPIEMAAVTELGGAPSTQTYVWTDEGVEHTVSGVGQPRTTLLAEPEGTWLTPAAAAAYVSARLAAGADEITVRSVDPMGGLRVGTTKRTGIAKEDLEVAGRSVEAFRMNSTVDLQPGIVTVEHLDDNGEPIRLETSMGGFDVVITASDRATATGTPAGLPPELMTSLFIEPSRPIRNAHRTRTASYVVRAKAGELSDLPSVGFQTAERLDEGSFRVVVDLNAAAEAFAGDSTDLYLASTVYLDTDDSAVRALARRAAGNVPNLAPDRLAERLRRAVHRHISAKDLTVGFATASEVARSAEGDCTEHAVLLAALLRAEGIPSRVVGGLVYADSFAGGKHIFGYHAWTQALIADAQGVQRWIDLDATMPGSRGYSAAHVALSVTALEDAGPVGGLTDLAPLLGQLEIDVESAR
ncbi:MAG: transglutaminase-like domain-containing protein [Planctomycetota bacterium]